MACEIRGQLPQENPDPQMLAESLRGRRLPVTPLLWAEDHPLSPSVYTRQSLAELAVRHTLVVYFTDAEAREEEESGETMGRAFRDCNEAIRDLGALVVGVSTQPLSEQHEISGLGLYPQTLFCDEHLVLGKTLVLPSTIRAARVEYQPLVLILKDAAIAHVVYPIDSPRESARAAVEWLVEHAEGSRREEL